MIFNIYAGYSIQPRNIYVYDILNDILKKSPKAGVVLNDIKIFDIDNDGQYELSGYTSGPGNIRKEMGIPYSDSSSYLMLINEDMADVLDSLMKRAYCVLVVQSHDRSQRQQPRYLHPPKG